MLILTLFACAIGLTIITSLYQNDNISINVNTINVVIFFFLRCAILSNFNAWNLYVLEYYPTAIRATALGLGYSLSRIGCSIGMYLSEDTNIVTEIHATILISILGCGIAYLLPEDTTGRVMVNDIDR